MRQVWGVYFAIKNDMGRVIVATSGGRARELLELSPYSPCVTTISASYSRNESIIAATQLNNMIIGRADVIIDGEQPSGRA